MCKKIFGPGEREREEKVSSRLEFSSSLTYATRVESLPASSPYDPSTLSTNNYLIWSIYFQERRGGGGPRRVANAWGSLLFLVWKKKATVSYSNYLNLGAFTVEERNW